MLDMYYSISYILSSDLFSALAKYFKAYILII